MTEGARARVVTPGRASDEAVELTTEIRGRIVSCRWSPSGVSGDDELLSRIARSAGTEDWGRSAAALVRAMRAAVPGEIHARACASLDMTDATRPRRSEWTTTG